MTRLLGMHRPAIEEFMKLADRGDTNGVGWDVYLALAKYALELEDELSVPPISGGRLRGLIGEDKAIPRASVVLAAERIMKVLSRVCKPT